MKKAGKFLAVTLGLSLLGLSLLTGCSQSSGQESADGKKGGSSSGNWPSRTITMLVPWSAGGGSDLAVRTLVPYLEEDLGVTVTVVNQTGANGWIAWNDLLHADADGYTIAQMNIPTVYSGYLDPQQNRSENLDNFLMVANEISDWGCMVVKAGDDRFPDAKTLIEYGKANELLAGDAGAGTNKHLLTENLNSKIEGMKLTPVHQSGWSDNYAALLGGHIDVAWGSIGETLQAYQDGEVDILCVFATDRSSLLPDIPTFHELMPELDITSPSDRGFALPAGVDQEIYDRWQQAMDKAINNPEFVQKMADLGQAVNYMNGEDYTAYVKEQETVMKGFSDILGWTK